jgi:hypothetical protein
MSRETCRAFALERSWEKSAQQFIGHVSRAAAYSFRPATQVQVQVRPAKRPALLNTPS